MAEVTMEMIKKLREKTGLGILDCKSALRDSGGDMDKAIEILRLAGKKVAAKKAGRKTAQGMIVSYVHMGGKIASLVEVNCETDFVARTDKFKQLAHELAMQVAAMNPLYVSRDTVPEEVLEKEKEIYRRQALEEGKPEKVIERIVDGKLERFFETACLMEQAYIKDQDRKIADIVNEKIQETGENIQVSRLVRFVLGESED